ncbi:MAG: T9SS type A sorting domain-containing protein [Fimbriimonadaceae bacterium]|nr:T9SS type A sorting domain-containing protein [Chitinophagales bacterium]
MKTIFTFTLLISISQLFSQTDPQWLFPIWFEDANGDRDTVYIGYDTGASSPTGFDEEFEDYIWIDTSKFNVVVNSGYPSPYTGNYNLDSGKIMEITNSFYPDADIDFINGQMPITMYWDISKLYDTDLPYVNILPYPIAIINVYCGANEPGYINCPNAFDDDPLTITDQSNPNYSYPIVSQYFFDGSGTPPTFNEPEEVLNSFYVILKPYQIFTGFLDLEFTNIVISPNPFKNEIYVKGDELIEEIIFVDLFGKLIKRNKVNDYTFKLEVEDIISGVYCILIKSNSNFYSYRIIKL